MKTQFSFTYRGERKTLTGAGTHVIDETLTVIAKREEYPAYNAAYWVLHFQNPSNEKSGIISDILDCDTLIDLPAVPFPPPGFMPGEENYCVTSMKGCVDGVNYSYDDAVSATEFSFSKDYLLPCRKKTAYECERGRSSSGMMPYFKVSAGGEGVILAVGWTGRWRAEFALAEGGVHVQTGLAEKTEFYLLPGEEIRTTSVLVMRYGKGADEYNQFRRLIKTHFAHNTGRPNTRDGLLAFELWGGLPSELMIKRVNELKAHGIRLEDLWIDAGWYGQCTKCDEAFSGDWAGFTGEWSVNTRVHPNSLTDVRDAAEDAGMRMMLWFEPERATHRVSDPQKHPEWFLSNGNEGHGYLINYGNPEALNYVLELLSGYIRALRMGCYRQDYNTGMLADFAAKNDLPYRKGLTEIKHIMGLYRLWDALLERFPGLMIDNCASGGRRMDFEALRRSVGFFRSDYQCEFNALAEVMQAHNSNVATLLPLTGCTTKVKGDTYHVRSAYSSSFGAAYYNAIFQEMDEADFAWAKQVTEEYRSIRHYFTKDFYNHGSRALDMTAWAIWQYHDAETGKGILMAFRRPESPSAAAEISLKGVPQGATLRCKNFNTGEEILAGSTLSVLLPEKRSSVIIEYEVQK